MPKKPWIILLLTFCYLIAAVLFFYIRVQTYGMPPININRILTLFMTSLYLLNALAIFSVKRNAWWIFLSSSIILILLNFYSYFNDNNSSLLMLFLANGLLFIGSALLFRREIIAPYFNPRLRWWESNPRYNIDFSITLHNDPPVSAKIVDISAGGCYISTLEELPLKIELPIELHLQELELRLQGKVLRKGKDPCIGWGIRFNSATGIEEEGLIILLQRLSSLSGNIQHAEEKRSHQRARIPQWIYWEDKGIQQISMLMNLSKSGCCIKSDKVHFEENVEYIMDFRSFEEGLCFKLRKIWQQNKDDLYLTGLEFIVESKAEKDKVHHLLDRYKKLGANHRNFKMQMDKELLQASLEMTPLAALYKGKK
ncbi:MAG: PilZ domain-containing protein [Spirochaetaceae bacterium]|jgi:hypothetical protein|nr:PilZ domain-containing protein [Spirochaetaceae bacterium]